MQLLLPNSDIKVFLLKNPEGFTDAKAPKVPEMPYSFMSYQENGDLGCEGFIEDFNDDVFGRLLSMLNSDYNNSTVRVFDRRNGILIKELV